MIDLTVESNLKEFSSEKLCDIIIVFRYLNLNKELAELSMSELSNRRINGDSFNFEDYINKNLKDLPSLDFQTLDFRTILSQIK